jgi:uncharacterized SAM-binding protein YcdF (DUF218 family)
MTRRQRGGVISRLLMVLTLCGFLGLVYLARLPLLRLVGSFWVAGEQPGRADAIIVSGDDNFAGDRASLAAALFRAGWAPQVVASGRMLRPYTGVAELIARDLESQGVPSNAVVRFAHHAGGTLEEAEALRGLAAERGWRGILLVTSNYHARRARYIFRHVFAPGVSVAVIPAQDSQFDPGSWWQSRNGRKLLFLEVVGYLVALWELRDDQRGTEPLPGASQQLLIAP